MHGGQVFLRHVSETSEKTMKHRSHAAIDESDASHSPSSPRMLDAPSRFGARRGRSRQYRMLWRWSTHPLRAVSTAVVFLLLYWRLLSGLGGNRNSQDKPLRESLRQSSIVPRVMHLTFNKRETKRSTQAYPIRPRNESHPIKYPMSQVVKQEALKDSEVYSFNRAEPLDLGDCHAQYEWQKTSFPTCNAIHEFDLSTPIARVVDPITRDEQLVENARIVANGYWRDVWIVRDEGTDSTRVLKTIKYVHEYNPRNFDRHRRDALAMERLTSSKYVVDIYGYCGHSSLSEYAGGGDIADAIWLTDERLDTQANNMSSMQKLHIATQAAIGLAAVHNIDKEGVASIAHTDIAPGQYLLINGRYKLNDFNRARFILWNNKTNETCSYRVGKNPGKNRAPEEYAYKPQTEKVDVYSLGNIFYMLLMKLWPFDDVSRKQVADYVKSGRRPSFYADVWNSTDLIDQAIKEAMMMAHVQDSVERASAREIEAFLKKKLEEYDPGRLQEWNDDPSSEKS